MTRTGPQRYPGASAAYWYGTKYPGSAMESNVIVWHTTEGTSLPTYGGGTSAPNFTAKPDFAKKRLVWYQHFDFDISSRALVNRSGGVETNTLNVVQVEIVGTCDPSTHKKWGSTPHLYTPELPDWAIRDLAAFAKWAHDHHGVPLSSGVTFKAYPSSYGNSSVRMSASKWNGFRGHCGHQHVPENDHGDPGLLPMAAILASAKGNTSTAAPRTPPPLQETPMPVWTTGPVLPGPQPTVALSPRGDAWHATTHRRLHLGMDTIGTPAKAEIRVAIHDGKKWRVKTVDLAAADGIVDVPMTAADEKVSLQTDSAGVAYAIEAW